MNINGLSFRVEKANTFHMRLKGLMGRKTIPPDRALVIYPCISVHTWFMRFPIDVVFLDKSGQVLWIIRNMAPYKISPVVKGSYYVIEMLGGVLPASIEVGQKIELEGGDINIQRR